MLQCIQKIKIPLLVAALGASLLVSGMNLAEAAPLGAKQYGSKTMSKIKTAEIKDKTQSSDNKAMNTKNHKGFQPEVKNEKVKADKKLAESQKAAEKLQKIYYKNPYVKSPYK